MKYTLIIAVLLISGCSTMPRIPGITSEGEIIKVVDDSLKQYGLSLLQKIESKNYSEAIEYYELISNESEREIDKEQIVTWELYSIFHTRKNIEDNLNEMVLTHGDSHVPYLIRGAYLAGKGWRARGNSVISQTTWFQINAMENYHELAEKDLRKGINIYPNEINFYLLLADIHLAYRSKINEYKADLENAEKIRPANFDLWQARLNSALPRWGGSIEEMKEVIISMKMQYSHNPRLRLLENRLMKEAADQAKFKRDRNVALNLYTKAIEIGEDPVVRNELANLQLQSNDYLTACNNVRKAISLRPYFWDANKNGSSPESVGNN